MRGSTFRALVRLSMSARRESSRSAASAATPAADGAEEVRVGACAVWRESWGVAGPGRSPRSARAQNIKMEAESCVLVSLTRRVSCLGFHWAVE